MNATRILWAGPLGGAAVGFVAGFIGAVIAGIVSAVANGMPLSVFELVVYPLLIGFSAAPWGVVVGIGTAVLGGLVIVVLLGMGEQPSTLMLVLAGAIGTLPGSLTMGALAAPHTPAFAIAIALVVAAVAAVCLWWLIRADFHRPRRD